MQKQCQNTITMITEDQEHEKEILVAISHGHVFNTQEHPLAQDQRTLNLLIANMKLMY